MNRHLQQALSDAGVSQSELARRLGIHVSHVNRWVARKLRPTVEQLKNAMAQLEVDDPMSLGYRIDSQPVVVDD